jgi:hypothetical protein
MANNFFFFLFSPSRSSLRENRKEEYKYKKTEREKNGRTREYKRIKDRKKERKGE